MKVVIVGGVACGAKTAARLARICPKAEITVLERGDDLSYANCGFPFYLGGEIANRTGLTHAAFGPERNSAFFDRYVFTKALTGHEAVLIDRERKQVAARTKNDGTEKIFPYDKLVLATGASPILPGTAGMELENVFTLWTLRDTISIHEALENKDLQKIVVVGSGLVGVETAEAFRKRGRHVTLLDAMPQPLPMVAQAEFGRMLQARLEENGVIFRGEERLMELLGDGAVRKVRTNKGEIDADIVVVSIGVRPNIDLARNAGLEIGSRAILVDEFMRTSDPDIYAGGDCVESRHIITGQRVWQPMGSTANRQGRVIADHIASLAGIGGAKSFFSGVSGTAIARVFDWVSGKTGLSFDAALDAGFTPMEILVSNHAIPNFMPGSAMIFTRLTADVLTRRILGAQIAGPAGVDKRLDAVVTALKGKLTVDDLADADLAYAPPFSSALDPVTHAANTLRNKMDGLLKSYSPFALRSKAARGEDFLILDVRNPHELERFGKLPYDVCHIPLSELKSRAKELPRNREIVTVCRAGIRAWTAYSMLKRYGYSKTALLEGGMAAWPYEIAKETS